ncbi:kinase-like protein [Rhizophagus irregularis]|uniref:Kinase-like protein n=2 Tax=Rhizophagus irregularis TaxID=588596 RepID=A0A2N0P8Y5_9GLOM|nr:kinase-like protein [Rhizophagus irregularis]
MLVKKNLYKDISEPRYGVFKTSDYNLNLEERRSKYKEYEFILCEKCSNAIYKWDCYCHIKFGSNFGILDCNLSLEKRRAKYMNFNGILFEKCNQEINNHYYYCMSCHYKETDIITKGHMGSNFGILDCNLILEERRAKYEKYSLIFCGKCNNEIFKWNYYCTSCYNKEINVIKKGHMRFGPNFEIFKKSDYCNLNLEERRAKYMNYDGILCEICYNQISKWNYHCIHCYNEETDTIKKGHIKFGTNFKIFNCNLNLEERKSKYEKYDGILCEKCNNEIDKQYYNYDRRVKYKNFDYILCEKCDRKYHYNYCYECFDKEMRELSSKLQDYENFYFKVYKKETKELRELKELQSILIDYKNVYFNLNSNLGIFKQIRQRFEITKYHYIGKNKIFINNMRYNGVHNCERELRSYCCDCYDNEIDIIEKKRMKFGKCKECLKIHEDLDGCLSCNPKHFQRDFDKWTSRNEIIDKLIQGNQNISRKYGLLEWISYDKFTNINYIAKGGFAKVYSAIWIDGPIKKWSQLSNNWKRNGSTTIALKVLNNSENISEDFLNELKFFNKVSGYLCIIKCFGITQDPITNNYALVLQYMENGDLRKYLERTANKITWDQRLNKIYDICLALNNIHIHGLIHKDLHPGNIFIDPTFAYIGDFGLCMPANEILSNSIKKNVYGIIPYMAPEILRGKPHTLASDVYSLGVIINEIITVIPPFNNQPHDHFLALDICRGLRPNIREETPTSLKELIIKCWDANPVNRPASKEILYILSNKLSEYRNMPLKLSYNLNESNELQPYPLATYMSRPLNFQNLLKSINCTNQQEFISSRYTKKIRTGQVNTLNSDECSDCIIMDIN